MSKPRTSRFFFWIGCAGFFAYFINVIIASAMIYTALVLDPAFSEVMGESFVQEADPFLPEFAFFLLDRLGTFGFWGGCACWLAALIAKAFGR